MNNPHPQDFRTSKIIALTGAWKSMILPFVGVLIVYTIVAIWGGSFIVMKFFGDRFESKGEAILVIILLLAGVLFAWLLAFVTHFPKKWKTKVEIDLEKECITLQTPKGDKEYHFSMIASIRYQAATSLFSTSYLYFVTGDRGKEEPLVALSDAAISTALFHFLKQRARLQVIQ